MWGCKPKCRHDCFLCSLVSMMPQKVLEAFAEPIKDVNLRSLSGSRSRSRTFWLDSL